VAPLASSVKGIAFHAMQSTPSFASSLQHLTLRGGNWRICEWITVDDCHLIDEMSETMQDSERIQRASKDFNDSVYSVQRRRAANASDSISAATIRRSPRRRRRPSWLPTLS
jgi:hypothetical protein